MYIVIKKLLEKLLASLFQRVMVRFALVLFVKLLQMNIDIFQGIILRREGKVQESLDAFQNSYNINSTNVDNVKQIAKSL